VYSSSNVTKIIKLRRIKDAGHVMLMWEMRRCRILVGRSESKRQFGRTRCRWKDDTNIYLNNIGFWDVDLIHVVRGWVL
jgi:hypothetical protein